MMNFQICGLCLMTLFLLPSCLGNQQNREDGSSIPQYETQIQFEGGLVQVPVSINGGNSTPFYFGYGTQQFDPLTGLC